MAARECEALVIATGLVFPSYQREETPPFGAVRLHVDAVHTAQYTHL